MTLICKSLRCLYYKLQNSEDRFISLKAYDCCLECYYFCCANPIVSSELMVEILEGMIQFDYDRFFECCNIPDSFPKMILSKDNDFQSAIQQLKAEILSRTNPLWVLRSGGADELKILGLSLWFVGLKISPATARGYAEILVETNTGSIEKLKKEVNKNSCFLEEIGDFDEKDIADIKAALKVLLASTATEVNDKTVLRPRYMPWFSSPFYAVPVFLVLLSFLFMTILNYYSRGSEMTVPLQSHSNNVFSKIASEGEKDLFSAVVETSTGRVLCRTAPRKGGNSVAAEKYLSRVSLEGHSSNVRSLSWSPVGDKIASGSDDNTIKTWDGKSLELLNTLTGHSSSVRSVSWNHNGSQIASGSLDNTVIIWDSSTGKALHSLKRNKSRSVLVDWNHDSNKIASSGCIVDPTIKIWVWTKSAPGDEMSWKLLKTLERHSEPVTSVSWNHDGNQIASGSWDKTIKIWDSSTGMVLRTLTGHSNWVQSVSWSHDGSKIVSCSHDQTVKIWNATTGKLMKTLEGHSGKINCIAWSPDDSKIASCSYYEKKIIIWDALTGQEMNSLQLVEGVSSVAWSPDGTEIASYDGGKIKVYRALSS
jgi:WD40 repeat protein